MVGFIRRRLAEAQGKVNTEEFVIAWYQYDVQCLKRSKGVQNNLLPTTDIVLKVENYLNELAKQYGLTATNLRDKLIQLRRDGFNHGECVDILNVQLARKGTSNDRQAGS